MPRGSPVTVWFASVRREPESSHQRLARDPARGGGGELCVLIRPSHPGAGWVLRAWLSAPLPTALPGFGAAPLTLSLPGSRASTFLQPGSRG